MKCSATNFTSDAAADGLAHELVNLANLLRLTADALVATGTALQTLCQQQIRDDEEVAMPRQARSTEPEAPVDRLPVPRFPPLEFETRFAVDTCTAAFHLNRKEQTLRGWSCHENGPVRPLRINGRLAWPVVELRRALGFAV